MDTYTISYMYIHRSKQILDYFVRLLIYTHYGWVGSGNLIPELKSRPDPKLSQICECDIATSTQRAMLRGTRPSLNTHIYMCIYTCTYIYSLYTDPYSKGPRGK